MAAQIGPARYVRQGAKPEQNYCIIGRIDADGTVQCTEFRGLQAVGQDKPWVEPGDPPPATGDYVTAW